MVSAFAMVQVTRHTTIPRVAEAAAQQGRFTFKLSL
jgi:hypothetical protein